MRAHLARPRRKPCNCASASSRPQRQIDTASPGYAIGEPGQRTHRRSKRDLSAITPGGRRPRLDCERHQAAAEAAPVQPSGPHHRRQESTPVSRAHLRRWTTVLPRLAAPRRDGEGDCRPDGPMPCPWSARLWCGVDHAEQVQGVLQPPKLVVAPMEAGMWHRIDRRQRGNAKFRWSYSAREGAPGIRQQRP